MDRDEMHVFQKLGKVVSESAQDREMFRECVLGTFKGICKDVAGYSGPEQMKKEDGALSQYEIALCHLSANVDMIYDHTESPIETLFLCNLLVTALRFNPFFLTITAPIVVDTTITAVAEQHKKIQHIRKDIRKNNNFPELWHVADRLSVHEDLTRIVTPMLLKHLEAIGDDLVNTMGYLEYGLGRSFHVSLQPSFEHIRVEEKHIRPDMVVWIPTRPDFRLVVECDGYQFHSNQEAFAKDRIRDRVLQQQGYQVFRFSGREIIQNATLKVNEFVDYLFELGEKFHLDLEKAQSVMRTFREEDDKEPEGYAPARPHRKKNLSPQQKRRQRHAQRHKR
jgi:hypothetical protein